MITVNRDTPDSDNDITCAKLKADERWKSSVKGSRPTSIASEPEKRWVDIVTGWLASHRKTKTENACLIFHRIRYRLCEQ